MKEGSGGCSLSRTSRSQSLFLLDLGHLEMLASLKHLKYSSSTLVASRGRYATRITRHYCSQETKQAENGSVESKAHLFDLEETVANQFAKHGTYTCLCVLGSGRFGHYDAIHRAKFEFDRRDPRN